MIPVATTSRAVPRIAGLRPSDAEDLLAIDRWAFPTPEFSAAELATELSTFEWGLTRGAYLPGSDGSDGSDGPDGSGAEVLAGVNSAYTMRLPVPGGEVGCHGLTYVGVHPLHRRRGVMSAMIADHLQQAQAAGRSVSVLHASEASIYGRFGYGNAMTQVTGRLARGAALRHVPGADAVRFRLETADPDRHADLVGSCFEAARRNRPGTASRDTPAQRRRVFFEPAFVRRDEEPLRLLIAEADDDGPVRGYALFRRTGGWIQGAEGTVRVRELVARDPAAARALWGRLLDLDLTAAVDTDRRAVDDPLLHLLVDARAARFTQSDSMWLRLVDLPTALAARQYSTALDVVIEVTDALLPENTGRWRLTGGAGAASCRPTADPAGFTLDVREVASAYLGSVSLVALAAAGLIEVHDSIALETAARAFAWPVAASCGWLF